MNMKGKREGITVYRHKVIPSLAPVSAVLASSISTSIAIAYTTEDALCHLDFIWITSKESMHLPEKTSLIYHRLA